MDNPICRPNHMTLALVDTGVVLQLLNASAQLSAAEDNLGCVNDMAQNRDSDRQQWGGCQEQEWDYYIPIDIYYIV